MFEIALIVLISIIAAILCVIILLQAGKGGGLAASFGGQSSSTDSFLGGRQTATALTKMSWYGGGAFLFLALVLTILSARSEELPESVLRQAGTPLSEPPPTLLNLESDASEILGEDPAESPSEGAAEEGADGTEDPGS